LNISHDYVSPQWFYTGTGNNTKVVAAVPATPAPRAAGGNGSGPATSTQKAAAALFSTPAAPGAVGAAPRTPVVAQMELFPGEEEEEEEQNPLAAAVNGGGRMPTPRGAYGPRSARRRTGY
jgi:hypothetical protein